MSIFIEANQIKKPYKLIDTRFSLADANAGYAMYEEAHIEGAIYWDLNKDLSDMTSAAGRHPMPSKEQLQSLFERSGLTLDDDILIYDQGGAPYAARAWFMLTYAGFSNAKIVNGGMQALLDAGFPYTNLLETVQPTTLQLQFNEALIATKEEVRQVTIGEKGSILLDARSHERYIGEIEPIDPVAGHIPTAQNFNWEHLLKESRFGETEMLRQTFNRGASYIVYCGSGVTAAPLFVTLYDEGYKDIQLYVGGYSDWITSEPVAIGNENKEK